MALRVINSTYYNYNLKILFIQINNMSVKPINFTVTMHNLTLALKNFSQDVEKISLDINTIKQLSSIFEDHKDNIKDLDFCSNQTIQVLQIKLKHDTLNCIKEEALKLNKSVIDNDHIKLLEDKIESLQKIIDNDLEKKKEELEEKYNEDLKDKVNTCKILSEKETIKYEAQIQMKDYKIEFLEKIVKKYEDNKSNI